MRPTWPDSSAISVRSGMLTVAFGLACLGPFVSVSEAGATDSEPSPETNSCLICHTGLKEDVPELYAPVETARGDIHWDVGHVCANCHGGDPLSDPEDADAAMDPAKGFVGKPDSGEIPEFCGRCHSDYDLIRQYDPRLSTDQVDQYWTSRHGQLLRKGDRKVATCISCHGVHGIHAANDPTSSVYPINIPETCGKCHDNPGYMSDYPIETGILAKYRTSVHGRDLYEQGDLSAPTCNDCHGNHGPLPPAAESISHVCGLCHVRNAELFNISPHRQPFAEMELSQCSECHGVHAIRPPQDDWLGTGVNSICLDCHGKGDAGYAVAERLGEQLNDLKRLYAEATILVERAERAGVEVSEAHYQLKDLKSSLIHARTETHAYSVEALTEVTGPAEELAGGITGICEDALAEAGVRRKGLAVSATFALVIIVLLFVVIRRLERNRGWGR